MVQQVLSCRFLLLRDGVAGVADLVLPVRERGLGGLVGGQRLVLAAQDHAAGGVGEQQLLDRARRRDRVHHGQLGVAPGLHPEHGAAEQLALLGDVGAGGAQLGRDPVEPVLGADQRAGETEPLGPGVPELARVPAATGPGRCRAGASPARAGGSSSRPRGWLPAGRRAPGGSGAAPGSACRAGRPRRRRTPGGSRSCRSRRRRRPARRRAGYGTGGVIGRTVGRGAGEGAHGCNQSFGEVNASTVSARGSDFDVFAGQQECRDQRQRRAQDHDAGTGTVPTSAST